MYRPRRTAGLYPLPRRAEPNRRRSSPPFLYPLTPFCFRPYDYSLSSRVDTHTDERTVLSFFESLPHPASRSRSVTHSLPVSGSPKTSKRVNFSFFTSQCQISCEHVFTLKFHDGHASMTNGRLTIQNMAMQGKNRDVY